MAERVGYDPETGLHLEEPPKQVPKHLLEEGIVPAFHRSMYIPHMFLSYMSGISSSDYHSCKCIKTTFRLKIYVIEVRVLNRAVAVLQTTSCWVKVASG